MIFFLILILNSLDVYQFRFFWKLVVNKNTKKGIVLIASNNPFEEYKNKNPLTTAAYENFRYLCKTNPTSSSLLNFMSSLYGNPDIFKKGFIYACEVKNLAKELKDELPLNKKANGDYTIGNLGGSTVTINGKLA